MMFLVYLNLKRKEFSMNWKNIYDGVISKTAFYKKWKKEIVDLNFKKGDEEKAKAYLIALKLGLPRLLKIYNYIKSS